jgi:hypothetical protein
MLNNLSAEIRECDRHAEDCARQAAAQTNQKLKQDFLDLEARWASLARSYDLVERQGDFLDEAKRWLDQLSKGTRR